MAKNTLVFHLVRSFYLAFFLAFFLSHITNFLNRENLKELILGFSNDSLYSLFL